MRFSFWGAALLVCASLVSDVVFADVIVYYNHRHTLSNAFANQSSQMTYIADDHSMPGEFSGGAPAVSGHFWGPGGLYPIINSYGSIDSSSFDSPGVDPVQYLWTVEGDATTTLYMDPEAALLVGFDSHAASIFDVAFELTDTAYLVEVWWELESTGDAAARWQMYNYYVNGVVNGSSTGNMSFGFDPGLYRLDALAFSDASSFVTTPDFGGSAHFALTVAFTPLGPPVPEPGTFALLGLGIAALITKLR